MVKPLTKRELQIMQILWNSASALTAKEITEVSGTLSHNTVQSVIRRLLRNNLVEISEVGYSGNVLARKYVPKILQEDYLAMEMSQTAVQRLMSGFINSQVTMSDLDHLEDLIQRKKAELLEKHKN